MKKSQLVTHSGKVCSSAGGWQLGNAYLQSAAVFYRGSFLQDFTLRNGSPHRDAHSGAGRSTTTERPLLNVPFVGRGAEVSRLMTLSSLDTLQIVLELAHADAAQLSCQGEHANFQPSSQHVHATGSGICPERFGVWLFSETNGQPFYLRALLQELLEQGVLLPRLIEGRGWVFEPQPSILEATPPNGMLPSDVREMIQRRLARLSSPARDLLVAGAVLGHDFTFEELCQVAQFAPQDGLVALDESLQSLLLRESSHWREGREEVSYYFAADKIRQVVYAAAGDARRRVFHGRAYDPGARAHYRRGAGLAHARQRIARSYVSVV